MRSDGLKPPSLVRMAFNRARFTLKGALAQDVVITDEQYTHRFRCEDPLEIYRAMTVLGKEEGTTRWIRAEVRAGDVFYDIGANIGQYTLLAARRLAPDGEVYAFEPNILNAHSLLRNVRHNGLERSVKVLSSALTDEEGFLDFDYVSPRPAALDLSEGDAARARPVYSEVKHATTIDSLIEAGVIRPANLVKIDVDGFEALVLGGMSKLLLGEARPRAVQVEVTPRSAPEVGELMQRHGFEFSERHETSFGQARIAAGADPASILRNEIFRPG
jgi:FkbM family methyltransferase